MSIVKRYQRKNPERVRISDIDVLDIHVGGAYLLIDQLNLHADSSVLLMKKKRGGVQKNLTKMHSNILLLIRAFIVHQIIHELPVLMHICIVSKNLTSFVLNIHIL
jgi:hypothetical protein